MHATSSQLVNLARFRILAFSLLIAYSQFYATHAGATPITIGLGASPQITWSNGASFTDLGGTDLLGQTLSLDFSFSNGKFVRLFSVTSNTFDIQVTLQTNGGGQVGFLDGTGYLFDQQGNPLDAPQVLGSASGNDGSMAAGLLPLLAGGLQRPLDFFGVHFDLILPNNPSVAITSSDFALVSDPGAPFGIGPGVPRDIVPETGSTLPLLSLGLFGAMLGRLGLRRLS